MNELFSFCDDHFKIFILIWLKLRKYYSEAKNKSLTTFNAGNYSLTVVNDYGCKSLSDV